MRSTRTADDNRPSAAFGGIDRRAAYRETGADGLSIQGIGAIMAQKKIYLVWGGVFNDTSWLTLRPETEERYGPYFTPEEARRVWFERTSRQVDDCEHRLVILEGEI
jgi:hypothetical protein